MDCLFGITGRDFTILASDCTSVRSIVVMKSTEQKFRQLNSLNVMTFCGESGDTTNFAEYIQANVQLQTIRGEGTGLGTSEVAHFARKQLANSLRSRKPYQVNILIGGVEVEGKEASQSSALAGAKPKLFWIDYLGAMIEVPFAAHGYGSYFCLSIMDRYYKPGMSEEEALELLRHCLRELRTRFIVNLPVFGVRIVRASGTEEILEFTV